MATYFRPPGTPIRRLGSMLIAGSLAISALLLRSEPAHAQTSIEAVITSDNAYSFGYGDDIAIFGEPAYLGKVENCGLSGAALIFSCSGGPEHYAFNVPSTTTYLYLVAWADRGSKQGILGQFKLESSSSPIFTGVGPWEVYRTNQPVIACDATDPQGPPLVGIKTQINHATTCRPQRLLHRRALLRAGVERAITKSCGSGPARFRDDWPGNREAAYPSRSRIHARRTGRKVRRWTGRIPTDRWSRNCPRRYGARWTNWSGRGRSGC